MLGNNCEGSSQMASPESHYNVVKQLVEDIKNNFNVAIQNVEAEDMSRGLYAPSTVSLLEYPKGKGQSVFLHI